MKKKEYVSPEMEIVEITEKGALLIGSDKDVEVGGNEEGEP